METLPDAGDNAIQVSNKRSRLKQIQEQVEELTGLLGSSAPRSRLESLCCTRPDTHGKCTQLACQLLHKFGGSGPSVSVTAELVHSVAEALDSLMTSKPRLISAWSDCPPLLLFTDRAVEDGDQGVTHGAILIDPWKQCSFYFGDEVPSEFLALWRRHGKKQIICQADILTVLTSKETWCSHIEGRSVLWFVDNEAARMALVRNFSPRLNNFSSCS